MPTPRKVQRIVKSATTENPLQTNNQPPADYWSLENALAKRLSSAENLERFSELCTTLKSKMAKIEELRLLKNTDHTLEISRIKTSCIATIIALRRLNRLDKHRLKGTRDAVKDNRSRVDGLHLQLQNLAYEAAHLRSEVDKCLEFKSMHEQIDLVSLEEFLSTAPEEIKQSRDEHEITMARLQHELTMRHELANRLESSVSRKKDLVKDIETKENILSKIQPTLNNILEAAQPLYSQLGMTLQVGQPEHTNSQYLCRPLYVIYVEGAAFQEVYPEMVSSVSIEGEVDEAKRVLDKLTGVDEESESDAEEVVVVKKKKRKTRTTTKTANQEEKNQMKAFLKPFPLCVKLILKTESGKLFPLSFFYLTSLKIVCAKLDVSILEVDTFLDGLYPNDNGSQSPNPTTHYLLAKNGVDNMERVLSLCKLGKPYQWAQWLGGLDFLTSSTASNNVDLSRKHFEQTLRLIRERLQTRVVLNEQLGQLAEGNVVADESRFPKRVTPRLEKFHKITLEDAMTKIAYGNGTDAVKDMMSKDSLFFEAKLSKDSSFMTALISVPQSYPQEKPFWFFSFEGKTSLSSGILRDLERTVNCYCEGEPSLLLSQQAMQALVSFEVMLDVDSLKVIRKTSGKDRAKPFNYEPSVGIFTPI